jgi:alpha-glucosidase (family GH31 glycosyl hydrolase)
MVEIKYWSALAAVVVSCFAAESAAVASGSTELEFGAHRIRVESTGFRFKFTDTTGTILAPAHGQAGLRLDGQAVTATEAHSDRPGHFTVMTAQGLKANVSVASSEGLVSIAVVPEKEGACKIDLSLGGLPVAYGLGDAGGWSGQLNLVTDKNVRYSLVNNGSSKRWQSSFVIFPHNGLAGVVFGGKQPSVLLGPEAYTMTVTADEPVTFYYLTGDMPEIYGNYKKLLVENGFPWIKPKSRFFELGWESWAALGYQTRDETVLKSISDFQKKGYPIRWAVTGSGFWEEGGTTTSFGKFGKKFPAPLAFKAKLHAQDVKWMIGLRTNFVLPGGPHIPKSAKRDFNLKGKFFNGNPLSTVGVDQGYFVTDTSGDLVVKTSRYFPIVPCYLLDGRNPQAVDWYTDHYRSWGVDGIKEDTMMDVGSDLLDIFNAPIARLADEGALVMARCGSFSSSGTLLRINDTKVDDMSQRTPVNYWHYAASGAPNVYSDTVGFRQMKNYTNKVVRHAWLMALTAGLAVGEVPYDWNEKQQGLFKRPFDFHYQIGPYLYDAAIKSYHSGYPYTLTPLGIAYPNDANAAEPAHYQWMAGESLLCAPLVKNYKSSQMDLYLPEGLWFDYDTGKKYQGPKLLKDFAMPRDKTPCFVGGKGVLIARESDDAPLTARIYPIIKESSPFVFTHPDGSSQTVITISDWKGMPVVENTTTGEGVLVRVDEASGAVSFEILPENNYQLKSNN